MILTAKDAKVSLRTQRKIENEKGKSYQVDFRAKTEQQGVYKYEIDYRRRRGSLDKYEIRYDKKLEIFYGTLKRIFEDDKVIVEKERPHK